MFWKVNMLKSDNSSKWVLCILQFILIKHIDKKRKTEDMTLISPVTGTNEKYTAYTLLQLTTEATL